MTGLSVENISFAYGPRRALNAVSFETAPGRFTALLGPNGAGKSTLFSLITGLIATGQGRITIDGMDIAKKPYAALARLGVVFQAQTLDLDLTVWRNLQYFGALHGLSGKDLATRIDTALHRLDMHARKHERVRDLNGGHRRRMEIARALLHDPQVLLLDEPTVGLDVASRHDITAYVHDLAKDTQMAVLWATHLVDEIAKDDHLVVLHRGHILAKGNRHDVTQGADLNTWFLTQTQGPA